MESERILAAGIAGFLSSWQAIAVYLIILLVLIGVLVVALVLRETAGPGRTAEPPSASEGEDKKERRRRFDGLSRIDEEKAELAGKTFDEEIGLRELCEGFRNYAAGKLRLYYDAEDIRRFVAGMAVSQILILQGMSGTGKTSLAHAFGEYVGNPSTVVPVQPMWKERTDLIGYYNEFTKRFNETDLLKKIYEANYSEEMYVTVLDEMNIARVEYYFAEFLSLLELPNAEERLLTVVSDKWESDPKQLKEGHILLPGNMWFVGTANNDDSTFAISDKVYDRAMILDLNRKAEVFTAGTYARTRMRAERFRELAREAERTNGMTERNRRRLRKLDEYMTERFRVTFGNRIRGQIERYIPVYVSCGGEELTALDDILSKKVMRKLSAQNPVHLRNNAESLCRYLDELFGEGNMPCCKETVRRLERNA